MATEETVIVGDYKRAPTGETNKTNCQLLFPYDFISVTRITSSISSERALPTATFPEMFVENPNKKGKIKRKRKEKSLKASSDYEPKSGILMLCRI